MKNKVILIVVILIAVLLSGFAIYKNNKSSENIVENNRQNAIEEEYQKAQETINTKYQYKDGKNIFVGNFNLENPCDSYNAEIQEVDGEKRLVITTQAYAGEEECTETNTERVFRVEIEGEQDDSILATLNDEVVNLNIFTVPEDEDIDDIDIFIKG